MRRDYRAWLEQQDYSANTINTQCSHASRVEQAYGDLDVQYESDGLQGLLQSLRYSSGDARRGGANPSKLAINGDVYKGLASFRAAVGLYRRFREGTGGAQSPEFAASASVVTSSDRPRSFDSNGERIGFERDLQSTLRKEIEQLEPGLVIIDEGVERAVASGYIDITARDAAGIVVAIELKAGTADRTAIGQILSYMGDLADEEAATVRGILVAHDFNRQAKSAAKMVPSLSLRAYAVKFSFVDALI